MDYTVFLLEMRFERVQLFFYFSTIVIIIAFLNNDVQILH